MAFLKKFMFKKISSKQLIILHIHDYKWSTLNFTKVGFYWYSKIELTVKANNNKGD